MEEDSTTDATGVDSDDFDLSAEDNITSTSTADSSDTSTDVDDDNAPSDADDTSDDDESTDKSEAKDAPVLDKDLDDWAEKAGLGKPETERERRAVQIARDNQREFSRRQAAVKSAKQLETVVDETSKVGESDENDDPIMAKMNAIERQLAITDNNLRVSNFYNAMSEAGTPVSNEEAEVMGNLLKQTAETDGKAGVDFLLKDMSRWHKLAKLEMSNDNSDEVSEATEKARLEERQKLARKTQAKGPSTSAKNNAPAKQKDELSKIWEDDNI